MSSTMEDNTGKQVDVAVEPVEERKRDVRGNLVAGLDIGTTKICCVIAEVFEAPNFPYGTTYWPR